MSIPECYRQQIAVFKPEFKDLKFDSSEEFSSWLKANTQIEIFFEDSGQDLIKFNVAASGEILHTEIPSLGHIYNGSLLLDNQELLIKGYEVAVWTPDLNEGGIIKYPILKVVRKDDNSK